MPDERAWAPAARALAQPVQIGSVHLRNGVMTASGTAGYGTELAGLLDLAALGAVRHQVAGGVRMGRQPGATAPPHDRRDAQRRRTAGTGPRRLAA